MERMWDGAVGFVTALLGLPWGMGKVVGGFWSWRGGGELAWVVCLINGMQVLVDNEWKCRRTRRRGRSRSVK